MIWLWVLPLLGLLLHLALVRYRLRDVEGDWEGLLSGRTARKARAFEDEAALTALMAEDTLAAARSAREAGDRREATRLFALACDVITIAVPDRTARLQAMRRCARMLAAMVPLPALVPAGFRLRAVATRAGLGLAVHHLLASTQERFRWLCVVLGWCYRAVARQAAASANGVRSAPAPEAPWRRFEDGLADFRTLDARHVEALRALLASTVAAAEVEREARAGAESRP